MDLYRLYVLTLQVCGKEELERYITIDENYIIVNRIGQNVKDRIEYKKKIFLEKENRTIKIKLIKIRNISRK